jgi:hemerythrin superfamily protein
MNAIELLIHDHQEAMSMMRQLEQADLGGQGKNPQHTEIFNDLQESLIVHAQMEEQVFYPALKQFDETRDWVGEAVEEHREVEQLLKQMAAKSPEQRDFQEKLRELRQSVEHHVEEEENEIFPKAEQHCGQQQLQEMARRMQEMKQGRARTTSPGSLRQQLH